MMNVIYLQCDMRFNPWMLEKIDDRSVLEHTIECCRKIGGKNRLVSGIYDCQENQMLVHTLKSRDVEVYISDENDVNKRFLSIVTQEEIGADYIIRVDGAQCLLDWDDITEVVQEMTETSMDFFRDASKCCLLPDVVSAVCLKKWKSELWDAERYFWVLEEKEDIKRYDFKKPGALVFDFRVKSNETLRICKNVMQHHLNPYDLSQRVIMGLRRSEYLVRTGLMGSWLLPPELGEFYYDETKEVNPWWTISAIHFVKKHLKKSMRVFEWGSGNSTLFFSQHVENVVAIEHDVKWYDKMKETVPENVNVKYVALEYGGGEYCNAIMKEKTPFDIISIDGRDRVRCAKNAVNRLKDNGVIIWDNADRKAYQEGYDYLEQLGFKKLELVGPLYYSPAIEDYTTIFYRENNIFEI